MRTQVFLFGLFISSLSVMAQGNAQKLLRLQKPLPELENHPNVPFSWSWNPISLAGKVALYGYQTILSDQTQAKCPQHPSCSEFCRQALHEQGFILGVALTGDRLLRCSPFNLSWELKSGKIEHNKLLDPVSIYRKLP